MSAAAARKKRRHQERLEAKNRAALAGLVVDPEGAGIVDQSPGEKKPAGGIWEQIVRDRGGDAAVGQSNEGGGDGERGEGSEPSSAAADAASAAAAAAEAAADAAVAAAAAATTAAAEARGRGQSAEDSSQSPSSRRRGSQRQYSDGSDVVTSQPTGEW